MINTWILARCAKSGAPSGSREGWLVAFPARPRGTGPGRIFSRIAAGIALALVLVVTAACAQPELVSPKLVPGPEAAVWPAPPETARYAFAGVLIGEQNFVPSDEREVDTMTSVFSWIAGLIIGEKSYVELRRPVSGMADDRGRILVVDASQRAVFVFDLPGRRFLKWDEAAPGVGFVAPVAIADDGTGGILVTDAELGEVFRLDGEGHPTQRFGKGALSRPTGIARDPSVGTIYVTDTAAHDLKLFNPQGELIDTLGDRGTEAGLFNTPTHLAFSRDRLYVADTLNFRVQAFDRRGDGTLSFGRLGLYVGDMTRPKGVAVGRDGRVYVVESYYDHLLVFSAEGKLLLPIGGTGKGIGQFYLPAGVWTDREGRVYVADMFNGRVVVFQELTIGMDR